MCCKYLASDDAQIAGATQQAQELLRQVLSAPPLNKEAKLWCALGTLKSRLYATTPLGSTNKRKRRLQGTEDGCGAKRRRMPNAGSEQRTAFKKAVALCKRGIQAVPNHEYVCFR